ncbi:serine/threonine protein phosphatase [Nocardia sp. NPDC052254]|uniref:PP2C family protein-serine/threonine phosphatase n=1 Tax=Nocardia sp. NPDC052254 TaxID=3155681 RepID=UPI00341209CE
MHTAVTTAITRRELMRLTGITAHSVSRRGGRSLNADAVSGYIDSAVGRSAFAVADGIGDHLLAARAARTVARVAARVAIGGSAVAGLLAAQQQLLREFPEPSADSCMVVAVGPTPDRVDGPCDIAWVGDCRAYHWNGRVLHQVTSDHTVAEMMSARGVTVAPRMHHLVTTSARTVRPEAVGHGITGTGIGRWLLSTDGVHKTLAMTDIKRILAESDSAAVAADTLADSAIRAGATDNTTALVFDHR